MIGSPVYTMHSAFNTSEHGSGVGHPIGDGHGTGVVSIVSRHPHFAVEHWHVVHVVVGIVLVVAMTYKLVIVNPVLNFVIENNIPSEPA